MDGIKVALILSSESFDKHLKECDEEANCEGRILVWKMSSDPNSFKPEPPFFCYSVLREESTLAGFVKRSWIHICFTANEAAHIAVLAKERMKLLLEKKQKELEEGKEERLAALAADLDLDVDLDDGEDLGTINVGANNFPED